MSQGRRDGYKKLLIVNYVPLQDEYQDALKCESNLDKIIKLHDLNEPACKNLSLLINTSFPLGEVAFGFVQNAKSLEFAKGNLKLAWDRIVSKYAQQTALSQLKLKHEFHDNKVDSFDKDPDEWISDLKGLQPQMTEFV